MQMVSGKESLEGGMDDSTHDGKEEDHYLSALEGGRVPRTRGTAELSCS